MGNTKWMLISSLGKAGRVVTWNMVDRMGLHIKKRDDERWLISWESTEQVAKDTYAKHADQERFLERVCNADMLGG